jgi:hypothetical protein
MEYAEMGDQISEIFGAWVLHSHDLEISGKKNIYI